MFLTIILKNILRLIFYFINHANSLKYKFAVVLYKSNNIRTSNTIYIPKAWIMNALSNLRLLIKY